MPRIIVTTDAASSALSDQAPVWLNEHVHSVHLSTDHAAAQLVERLAWAIDDAEKAEGASTAPAQRGTARARARRATKRSPQRRAVRA